MRTFRLALAAAGTLVLLAGLSAPALSQDDEVIGALGANYFTATDTPISGPEFDWVPGPDFTEAAAVTAVSDFAASDPRISGRATYTSTIRFYPYGEEGGIDPALWASSVRIENDDGSWIGTGSGFHDSDEAFREWYVLDGQDAYEGLTAVFRFVDGEANEGVIVPGGLPPVEPAE